MMARNYGLWGAIAGICLFALLGVAGAANWLNGSTASRDSDQTVSIEGARLRGEAANGDFVLGEGNQTQTNTRFGDRSSTRASETLTFTPLEKAGTYVQRQKRAEQDAVVASTRVNAVSVASNNASNPVPAQPNTRVVQPTPTIISDSQPAQPKPAAAPPAAPAVPALW